MLFFPAHVQPDGRTTVFLYLVTRRAGGLSGLPASTRRPLGRAAGVDASAAPAPHLGDASTRFLGACHDTLANPVRLSTLDEARWYFEACRRLAAEPAQAQDARFRRAQQAFGAPRFRALYRAWPWQGTPCWMMRDPPAG